MGRKQSVAPPPQKLSFQDILPGVLACALAIALPLFPDEKLTRVKLLAVELCVLALAAVAGGQTLWTGRWKIFSLQTRVLIAAVVAWIGAQTVLYVLSPEAVLAQAELRRVVLACGAFLAFSLAGLSSDWKNRFLKTWGFSAGLIAIYGLLQHNGGMGALQVPQMDRVMGTFGNPIFFAAYLAPSMFVTAEALKIEKNSFLKLLLTAALFAEAAALYLTKTRAAWLALAGALFVLLLKKFPSAKAWGAVLLVFVAAGGVFAIKTKSVWERDQGHMMIWRDTLRMAMDHPLMGVGLGAFHTNFPSYAQPDLMSKWPKGEFIVNYAHNEYLQELAEGGIIGLGSFLLVIGVFGWCVFKKMSPDSVPLVPLSALTLLIQNFFSVDMRFSISFAIFFLLMGLYVDEPVISEQGKRNGLGAGIWILALAALIPSILKPYRAQQVVSSTPGFFDARVLDPLKTIDDLEKAAQQYPDQPEVLEKLAYVYAKEIKGADGKVNPDMANKAARAYQRLAELDPKRLSAYNNLANIQYTMGQVDQAIASWKKTLEVDPNFLDAHLNLGKVLYVRGDLKESAAHFEKVLKLDPKNSEAIVYLKRMVE